MRLRPAAAWTLIERWAENVDLFDLDPAERWKALQAGVRSKVVGGQIQDYLNAACARRAGVQTLVTWNLRHFARWAGPDLEVVNPLGERSRP